MEILIAFFSSDSRPLYKSDIYNSMCLPLGYVIHFRYKKHNIENAILADIEALKQKKGVIFFAKSHESESGRLLLETENISIRTVSIVDVVVDNDTELIHFYLQLSRYRDYKIKDVSSKIPPFLFVSTLRLEGGTKDRWSDRVNAIRESFKGQLFFKIQLIKERSNKIVLPSYEPKENQCFFDLEDETEYILNLDFAHTDDITKGIVKFPVLQIEDKTKQIDINISEYVDIGGNIDNRKIRMVTKSISNSNIDSFLVFKVVVYDHLQNKIENILQSFSITSRISKRYLSVFLFSLNSTLAVMAVGCMAIFVNKLKDGLTDYTVFVFALIFTASSSGMLYRMFNKK